MTEEELQQFIYTTYPKETQKVEWKCFHTLKQNVSGRAKEDIVSYISGIANADGGTLIIGIEDKTGVIIGINDFSDYTIDNIKARIHGSMYQLDVAKLSIEEITTIDTNKTIWIINIPKHIPKQQVIAHNNAYERVGDNLLIMSELRRQQILNETSTEIDRSGLPCKESTLEDIDPEALGFLREKRNIITDSSKELTDDTVSFLNRLGLLKNGVPNNTCILFIGKQESAERFLPEIHKISRRYIDEKNTIEERLPIHEQKSPLVFTITKVIASINRFNTVLKDNDIFRDDLRQYDEKSIEELLINSLAHRDWSIPLRNEVIQTPESLSFKNPGEFKADLWKVLKENQNIPYKNPAMADFLQKINLMERERQGLQKVYKAQLSRGVSVSFKQEDNGHGGIVSFTLSGKVSNIDFAKLVLKKQDIPLYDLLLLDKVVSGKSLIGENISEVEALYLKEKGYVEFTGRKPARLVRLSYKFLDEIDNPEKYVMDKGIKKSEKKKLILEFLEKKGKIQVKNAMKLFPGVNKNTILGLLADMCNEGIIKRVNPAGSARSLWFYEMPEKGIAKRGIRVDLN